MPDCIKFHNFTKLNFNKMSAKIILINVQYKRFVCVLLIAQVLGSYSAHISVNFTFLVEEF